MVHRHLHVAVIETTALPIPDAHDGLVRGIEQRGRLGVVYTNQDYGCEWDYDWRNKRFRVEDNTRFAVNVAVYVMT